jgi:hypothetical protein
MTIEDLDLFFADFGVSFTAGAISGICIKDMSGFGILDDRIVDPGHVVLVKTSAFNNLFSGISATVAGQPFTIKDAMPIEDGAFSLVALKEIDLPSVPVLILDGDFL